MPQQYLYVQLIDDDEGKIISAVRADKAVRAAHDLGKSIALVAKEKKIEKVVFDRGGYKYHGLVRQLGEGAREGGLKF
jgi:large subunit ribosomal protein L18